MHSNSYFPHRNHVSSVSKNLIKRSWCFWTKILLLNILSTHMYKLCNRRQIIVSLFQTQSYISWILKIMIKQFFNSIRMFYIVYTTVWSHNAVTISCSLYNNDAVCKKRVRGTQIYIFSRRYSKHLTILILPW